LNKGNVLCHPFIIGELAYGSIKNRKLTGKRLGYVDVHFLASAILSDSFIWSLDKKLNEIALELNIGFRN